MKDYALVTMACAVCIELMLWRILVFKPLEFPSIRSNSCRLSTFEFFKTHGGIASADFNHTERHTNGARDRIEKGGDARSGS